MWDPLVLATKNEAATRKRFLSRTARYSGLLNILKVVETDILNKEQLTPLLDGAKAWIAFKVPQEDVVSLSKTAIEANVKRVLFTVELPSHRINDTSLSEFTEAVSLFKASGGHFTGIRHGEVIPGDEDNVYEIMNATLPVLEPYVEKGVLGRVIAELLQIESAGNIECGLSSSSAFAGAYLNVLRSSGLTRREEVERVLLGGVQRVARLQINQYEEKKKRMEDAKAKEEQNKVRPSPHSYQQTIRTTFPNEGCAAMKFRTLALTR